MTRRAVLWAHPAGHSLSPVLHDAAFAALGVDATYEAWDVPPEALGDAVARLRDDAFLGANVSVPHKRAVQAHLDDVRPRAAAMDAVNLVVKEGGRLVGDNVDAVGLTRSLQEAGVDPGGRPLVLFGAGGAARAAAWAALEAGATSLAIHNRSAGPATTLAHDVADAFPGRDVVVRTGGAQDAASDAAPDAAATDPAAVWGAADAAEGAAAAPLVVQATSLGMARGGTADPRTPVPAAAWAALAARHPDAVAVDLVYRPRRTPFLRDAAAAGLTTVDGVGMLLHQGAASFEAWTHATAPLDVMRAALEAALAGETSP